MREGKSPCWIESCNISDFLSIIIVIFVSENMAAYKSL